MNRILSLPILVLIFISNYSIAQTTVETDLSFNTADTVPYGKGASGWINNSVVQPDGKIIIIGPINLFNGQPTGGLLRLNPNGTIDNSFNAWYNSSSEAVISIYLQADGKVLVGGAFSSFNGVPHNSIVRLNSDGSLDPGFDSGTGIAGPYGDPNSIKKITVDANGKILIGGCFASYNGNVSNCIARLNADGTFDNSFNSGLGFSAPLNQPSINEIEIQSDGKLLVGGNVNNYNGTSISNIIRLNADGSVDNSITFGSGFNGHVLSINSLPDGKMIVAGEFTSFNGYPVGNITRLLSNGIFDLTFNSTGSYTSGANAQITKTVIQNDGKIIAVGTFSEYNEISSPGITKLNADGSPDTLIYSGLSIFGGIGGAILLPNNDVLVWGVFTRRIAKYNSDGSFNYSFLDGTGANAIVSDLAKQPDGKIIVCGGFHAYNAEERFSLIRLNTDGSRDTGFNLNITNGYIGSTIVQPDGKILARGTIETFSGITRLNSDGTVDPAFNMSTIYGYVAAMALQPDGKIIAGTYLASSGIDQIVRFNSDGTLDNSFTAPNLDGQFFDIAIQSNGQIIVGGDFSAYDAGYTTELAKDVIRLNTDGSLDQSFGVTLDVVSGVGNWVQSIVQQPDQKILIAGNFIKVNGAYHYRIARLNLNGTIDPTFLAIGANNAIKDLALTQDGKIVMGGTFTSVNGTPTHYITRLNPNGTLDPDFTVAADSSVLSVLIQDDGNIVIGGMFAKIDNVLKNHIGRITGGCSPTFATETANTNCSYTWSANNQTYTSSGQYIDTIPSVSGCDSIITLNLTVSNGSTTGIDTQVSNCTYTWIDGITYTVSNNTATFTLTNTNGCDSIVTLDLTILSSVPTVITNMFSLPSDPNNCVGEIAVNITGNSDFELNIDGLQTATSSGYHLFTDLCPGIHDLQIINFCNDTTTTQFVIPIDSNYVFNNPFIDSLAQDSLGLTLTDCDIYYAGIDTAYIDSIWATGNTVNVIWNIVDSNGSNFDTTTYVLNNGNGVYWLQLSVFCPVKALGDYFTVTEAIYFENGHVSSAGIAENDSDNFMLYPNPTNDLITIQFDGNNAYYMIYDAQGKLIQSSNITSGGTVSLKDVQTGVYFLELKTENGSAVKRVVKN